jgi:hypothetical protein
VTGTRRDPSEHGDLSAEPHASLPLAALAFQGVWNPYEAPTSIIPERFSRFRLTAEPGSAFHRNPAKPGGLSDSCAEPSKRLALRCELVPAKLRDAYYDLVLKWTGINPCHQLTAGAASTHKVPGGPGVAFDGLRVWTIDDDDFAVRLGRGRADLASKGQIYRSAPGFPLNPVQYSGRLALTVVVRAVREGASESGAAARAAEFLKELAVFYAPDQGCIPNLGAVTPQDIDAVVAGLSNFQKLEANWVQVVDAVRDTHAKLADKCSCRL